jgi:hypothetical protein
MDALFLERYPVSISTTILVCECRDDPKVRVTMLLVGTEARAKFHSMEISVGDARIHFLRQMMGI